MKAFGGVPEGPNDRKGKNKFDVGYNKLHNVHAANIRQLITSDQIPVDNLTNDIFNHVIDPIVSFGNPPSRSNPMGSVYGSNWGNKGLNGFMSNIMVFSTDLKEEEMNGSKEMQMSFEDY